jgi:predicted component of type VI protein secretion system
MVGLPGRYCDKRCVVVFLLMPMIALIVLGTAGCDKSGKPYFLSNPQKEAAIKASQEEAEKEAITGLDSEKAASESRIAYVDSDVFDKQLSRALSEGLPEVTVTATAPFGVDNVPKRFDRWLTKADEFGSRITLEAEPETEVTRNFLSKLYSLTFGALFGGRDKLYEPVKNYDLKVFYQKSSGHVTRMVFTDKASADAAAAAATPGRTEKEEEVEPIVQMDLTIIGSDKLNWVNEQPHALTLCVYQLSGPGVISTRRQSKEGLQELLSCQLLDSSILFYERVSVIPSSRIKKIVPRAEGAKYIAVVAGYFDFSGGRTTVLTEFNNTAGRLDLGKNSLKLVKTGRQGE